MHTVIGHNVTIILKKMLQRLGEIVEWRKKRIVTAHELFRSIRKAYRADPSIAKPMFSPHAYETNNQHKTISHVVSALFSSSSSSNFYSNHTRYGNSILYFQAHIRPFRMRLLARVTRLRIEYQS